MAESNYRCNDCERGFRTKAAWEYHGENTGHNINGDLPGRSDREHGELRKQLEDALAANQKIMAERNKMADKLNALYLIVKL